MGDWFLFYMLGQNVDSMIFKEVSYSTLALRVQHTNRGIFLLKVMHELARRLGHQSKDFNDA